MPRRKLNSDQPNKYRSRDIILERRERRAREQREAEQVRAQRALARSQMTPAQRCDVVNIIGRLNQQPALRVFLAESANFGHYACTINLMIRLTELGFTGNFDVVLDQRGGDSESKLRRLMPQFKAFVNALHFAPQNSFLFHGCRTICRQMVRDGCINDIATPIEALGIGITGGIDDDKGISAAGLGVTDFIRLQPYLWKDGVNELILSGGSINLERKYPRSYYTRRTFYRSDPDAADLVNVDDSVVKQVATYLCAEARVGRINMCPVYGLHTWSDPVQVLSTYALALLYAQTCDAPARLRESSAISAAHWRETRARRKRKSVIVVLGDWSKKLRDPRPMSLVEYRVKHGAANSMFDRPSEAFKAFLTQVDAANRVIVKSACRAPSLFDPTPTLVDITGVVAGMADHQVLIVELGEVEIPLFNYLYAEANLPSIFEGQSTAELALNLGKPYLHLKHGDHYPVLPLSSTQRSPFMTSLQTVVTCLERPSHRDWQTDPRTKQNPAETIAEFILDSVCSVDNELLRYFESLRAFFHREERGKLETTLRIYWQETTNGAGWKDQLSGSEFHRISSGEY